MSEKLLFYDEYKREDEIYAIHRISCGYEQEYQHFHGKYELNFVLSTNESSVFCGGQTYRCTKPHIRLHKPYSFHIASADKNQVYDRFIFYFGEKSVEFTSGLIDLKQLFSDDLGIAPLEGDALECAKNLASAAVREDVDRTMQRMALAGLLALAGKFHVNPGNLNGGAGGYISEVLDYINRNYQQKLSAAELAKRFYVSEQKLYADFKAFMNETLHHYLISVKVARAADMIARGVSPVIASAECGFTDESHFSKTFKSRTGMTPFQFRKNIICEFGYSKD